MELNIRKGGIALWNWLFNNAIYISVLATVILSVVDVSHWTEWKIDVLGIKDFQIGNLIYWLTVFFAVVCGIFAAQNAKEVDNLEKGNLSKDEKISSLESTIDNAVTSNNELFNSYLKLLLRNLEFTHQERVSVYKSYNRTFSLIGRTSLNPTLKVVGRANYPIGDGFIGKGWAEGEFFVNNLPSPENLPEYHQAVNAIAPISMQVIENMKMQSRTYYVYSMNGYNGEPNAVLVIESLREEGFEKDFITEKLEEVKEPLQMFIEKNIILETNNANLAQNSGF